LIVLGFMVSLKNYTGINPNTINMMKSIYSWSVPDKGAEVPEIIVLRLDHPDGQFLKKGMRIRVKGYTLRGDEGGDWVSCKEIVILP
jgi:hypothetical protein